MEELRSVAVQTIAESFDQADAQAYLNRDDPRHDEIVSQATAIVESVFNEPTGPGSVLHPEESELRQSMYDDPRSIEDQLREIFNPKSEAGRAYLDGSNPKHAEMVQRAQILMEARHDENPRRDPDAHWPVRIKTKPNVQQVAGFERDND